MHCVSKGHFSYCYHRVYDRLKLYVIIYTPQNEILGTPLAEVVTTGSPLVIEVEDTEDSKPKDGRR